MCVPDRPSATLPARETPVSLAIPCRKTRGEKEITDGWSSRPWKVKTGREAIILLRVKDEGARSYSVKVGDCPFESMAAVLRAAVMSVCDQGYRLRKKTPEVPDKNSHPAYGREYPCIYCSVSTKGRNQGITCKKANSCARG